MEEIHFKFSNSQDLAVIEGAGMRLWQLMSSGKPEMEPEIQKFLLQEGLPSQNLFVSEVSSRILIKSVNHGLLDPALTLSSLLTIAPQVKHGEGLVEVVGHILHVQILHLCQKNEGKFRPYRIAKNPHPFVSLLRTSAVLYWPHVNNQIWSFLASEKTNREVRLMSVDFFRPVFMFVFCDPHHQNPLSAMRSGLMDLLLNLIQTESDEALKTSLVELTSDLITWMNMNVIQNFSENSNFILRFLKMDLAPINEIRISLISSLVVKSFRLGMKPRTILKVLMDALIKEKAPNLVLDLVIFNLCRCMSYSLNENVTDILDILLLILKQHTPNKILYGIVISSILPILSNQVQLLKDVSCSVHQIFITNSGEKSSHNYSQEFPQLIIEDSDIREPLEIVKLSIQLSRFDDRTVEWISQLSLSVNDIHGHIDFTLPILSSLALNDQLINVNEMERKVWTMLVLAAQEKPFQLSHKILSLLMFKLSYKSSSSMKRMDLLHLLPKLGGDRTCVGVILQLINSLSANSDLKHFRLKLLFDLWKKEDRIYPSLKAALEEVPKFSTTQRFLFGMTKAKVARDICLLKPIQHGADLLPILSGLLNEFTSDIGICYLALEGITALCKSSVIDIRTTIKVLTPKLWPYPKLVIKFLEVISVITHFDLDNPDFLQFEAETLSSLWNRLENETSIEVRQALLKTIGKFKIRSFLLKSLPKFCKVGLKYPSGYNLPVEGPAPDPEDVLKFIPGQCFVHLITESSDEDYANSYANVVQNLLEEEIKNLPRSVYYLSATMSDKGQEPTNWHHLNETSILKEVLAKILAHLAGKIKISEVKLKLLMDLLAFKRKQNLPPLNWAILESLDFCKEKLLKICVKQCPLSLSAKTIVMRSMEQVCSDLETRLLFENLHLFCDQIHEKTLTPFIEDSFHRVFIKEEESDISAVIAGIHTAILESSEASKQTLISSIHSVIASYDRKVLNYLEPLLPLLPKDNLDVLCDISNSVTMDSFLKIAFIRTNLACHHNDKEYRMSWLDAINEFSAESPEFQAELIPFLKKAAIFNRTDRSIETSRNSRQWLLELMGHARSVSKIGEEKKKNKLFLVLLETFVLVSIHWSFVDIFLSHSKQLQLLPLAIEKLLKMDSVWSSIGPQLSEWLLDIYYCPMLPPNVKKVLRKSFTALKNCEKYSEATVWSRLVLV